MSKQRKSTSPYPNESKSTSSAYKSRTDPPEYFVMVYLDGREPEGVIIEDGIEYERTDRIPIDLGAMPNHMRDRLSRVALSLTEEYFSQPGAEERYQEWLKNRKERLNPDI